LFYYFSNYLECLSLSSISSLDKGQGWKGLPGKKTLAYYEYL
jgi:hypothetical protein